MKTPATIKSTARISPIGDTGTSVARSRCPFQSVERSLDAANRERLQVGARAENQSQREVVHIKRTRRFGGVQGWSGVGLGVAETLLIRCSPSRGVPQPG